MSDAGKLLLVLILLYLSDCMVFVHRHAIMLQAFFRRYHVRSADGALGSARGALMWLNPLPPFGTVLLSRPWPLSFSPDAVAAYSAQTLSPLGRPPQTGLRFRFDDISDVAVSGRDLCINGNVFAECESEPAAARFAELIRLLCTLQAGDREAALQKAWSATLDPTGLDQRLADFRRGTRALRILCAGLWVYLFVVSPALITILGSLMLLLPLIGGVILLHVPVVLLYRRAHRRFLPGHVADRFDHTLKMAPCPPMAIRAVDAVSRHIAEPTHPVAAAALLAKRAEFEAFAAGLIRDMRHPIHPLPDDPLTRATDAWFRERQILWLTPFLSARGMTLDAILAPPPGCSDSHSYCPRCHGLFTLSAGDCPDCSGVPLSTIAPAQRSSA
jgi:hypothetical protein